MVRFSKTLALLNHRGHIQDQFGETNALVWSMEFLLNLPIGPCESGGQTSAARSSTKDDICNVFLDYLVAMPFGATRLNLDISP